MPKDAAKFKYSEEIIIDSDFIPTDIILMQAIDRIRSIYKSFDEKVPTVEYRNKYATVFKELNKALNNDFKGTVFL